MKIAITGTSQGLGKAIKKELQTNYTICEFRRSFKYDLTKIENIKLFANTYASIDVLILNAGISYFYKINELTQLEIINIINWMIIVCAITTGILLIFIEPIKFIVWLWLFVVIFSRMELFVTRK